MSESKKRLKVLIVPDFNAWVTGTIAHEIATHCQGIMATVCSDPGYRFLLSKYGQSVFHGFDLVHFLDAQLSGRHGAFSSQNLPTVCTINHYENDSSLNCVEHADRVMTLCDQQRHLLVKEGVSSDQIDTMRVGCDTSIFGQASPEQKSVIRERLGFREDQMVVGFVAKKAISGRKGSDVLLRAIEGITSENSDRYSFLIIGPGWSELVESLRERGVTVHYSSYVDDHHSLAPLYQCMDVFWVTSRIEGGPVPLVEAMASGVYPITTEVGIAGELVKPGINGVLVPFDDPESVIAETVAWAGLAKQDVERLASEAVKTVASAWQWRQVVQSVVPMYRNAVDVGQSRLDSEGRSTSRSVTDDRPTWDSRMIRQIRALDVDAFAENLEMIGEARVANAYRRRQIMRDPFGHATVPIIRRWISSSRLGAFYRWSRKRLGMGTDLETPVQ